MNRNPIISLSATLMLAAVTPTSSAAQQQNKTHHHYKLVDVGTLGGPAGGLFDSQNQLTRNGTLVGWADTVVPDPYAPNCFNPDCVIQHGFQWKDGVLTDLGALPGVNNSQAEATNEHGLIVGQSENGLIDPYLNIPATDVVAWHKGMLHNLGTLGGYQGVAFDVNNLGQITGVATNTIPDQYSLLPFLSGTPGGTQSRAFLWDGGSMHDLGTLGGPDAFGQFVNARGQVAGFSYTSSTPGPPFGIPPVDPFLWDKTTGMLDLGNFGGNFCNPFHLNSRGQFVGSMNTAGDQTAHPFLWNGEKMIDLGTLSGDYGQADWVNETGDVVGVSFYADGEARAVLWEHEHPKIMDLGTLPGDNCSIAWAMNQKGQIVGFSAAQDIGNTGSCFDNVSTITAIRAALWENGTVVDLNTVISPDSGVLLVIAKQINDHGEIAVVGDPPGVALDNGNNEAHGHDFLLIPCDENHPNIQGCDYSLVPESASATVTGSAPVTQMLATGEARRFDLVGLTMRSVHRRLIPGSRGLGAEPPR